MRISINKDIINKNNITKIDNFILNPVLRFIILQILNYIKFSQKIPMISFLFLMIGLTIIAFVYILFLFFNFSSPQLINNILNFLANINPNFYINVQIGLLEIMKFYGWLSLIFYAGGIIFKKIAKIKIVLSFRKKIKLLIIITSICYGIIFLYFYLIRSQLAENIYFGDFYPVLSIFYLLTIIFSTYSFFISKIIDTFIFYIDQLHYKNADFNQGNT